jgi:hypothetical protein
MVVHYQRRRALTSKHTTAVILYPGCKKPFAVIGEWVPPRWNVSESFYVTFPDINGINARFSHGDTKPKRRALGDALRYAVGHYRARAFAGILAA